MRNKSRTEKDSTKDVSPKIIREAEEVRDLIEKKKIQNNIMKKLIGNIPKVSERSSHKSNN